MFKSLLCLVVITLLLSGCGNLTEEADKTFTIGGKVSGLKGSGLQLSNKNNKDVITITKNGSFNFIEQVEFNQPFEIIVDKNPSNPKQICTVNRGKGTMGNIDITNLEVICVTEKFSVGGTLSGLCSPADAINQPICGSSLFIRNNLSDVLTITTDGSFKFAIAQSNTIYDDLGNYDITFMNQPTSPDLSCTLTNSKGQINGGNVTDVLINCVDNTPPTTASLYPINNATGTSRNSKPMITFSEPMKKSVINDNSLLIKDQLDTRVAGSVELSGDLKTLTFTPAQTLAASTLWTISVAHESVSDARDNHPGETVWQFSTADGFWNAHTAIEERTKSAISPHMASDAASNRIAVWSQSDNDRVRIFANYAASGDWSAANAAAIDNPSNAADAINPKVIFDPNGNAIAVWEQSDGQYNKIWAKRYDKTTGWQAATLTSISAATGDAHSPQLALANNGDVLAVWSQFDGDYVRVYFNRYDSTNLLWQTATRIETIENGNSWLPQIASDNDGNIYVVWNHESQTQRRIYATRFSSSDAIPAPVAIDDATNGDAYQPAIAVDESNVAFVVWSQSVGNQLRIFASRYSGGWSSPNLLNSAANGNAYAPRVALDGTGKALAVWQQYNNDALTHSIAYTRYNGTSWSPAAVVDPNSENNAIQPQVVFDATGNAIAIWIQAENDLYRLMASRYNQQSAAWGTPEAISAAINGDVSQAHLQQRASATTEVIWSESNQFFDNIYFRDYVIP